MVKRILALDVGERRIGVAVSDLLGITAQGVETIFTQGPEKDVQRVLELAARYETDRVLSGIPKLLGGEEGAQAARVRAFAQMLTEKGLAVRFQDERFSSVSAEKVLIEAGVSREGRKKVIDKLAATYILQSYLDAGGWDGKLNTGSIEREVYRCMDGYMDADNIVELVDEDGKELHFQHLMTLDYNDKSYVVLAAVEDMEDVGEDEALILRIESDEDGNDVYSSIEDDEELEAVFARYLEIAEEDEDGDEEEDEEDEEDEDDDQ